ncbi:TolB amino-terminal domain-containing protein [Lutibacter oricola]|uniref:TolB amino-terminal domain-containing protein n=1 Tax=Lutibacter oricola TaxID=762486 RepID=A0A1H2SND3_9FLAO|nr:helix-turn-helix domain-containing protein [Lutibacter oricola]SDW33122.1 TolB amino-terminal domain-containing protein [Lutibacter oricola]
MADSSKSIAVLPFVNMSNDVNNEYFSDGITEEIINALTKIEGLKVIARTSSFSFKGKNIDIRTIGEKLSVKTILEGSVRKSQNRVRITAQLIESETGLHYWSENFDRELDDIFQLQDEISLLIADRIRENFGHLNINEHLVLIDTKNVEAYQAYLKARALQLNWNLEDIYKAIKQYKKCIEIDENYSDAYIAIGWCYGILASWGFMDQEEGFSLSEFFLNKGKELNPNSFKLYFAQSTNSFWRDWNYKKGLEFLNKSIEINPGYSDVFEAKAEIFTAIGYWKEAIKYVDKALDLNPLSPNHFYTKGVIYYLNKDYNTALKYLEKAIEIDSEFSLAIQTKLACFIWLNNWKSFVNFIESNDVLKDLKLVLHKLFCSINKKELPNASLNKLLNSNSETKQSSLIDWDFYLAIQEENLETNFQKLEYIINTKPGQFVNFNNDPFLKILRKEPKFKALQDKVFYNDVLPIKNEVKKSKPRQLLLSEDEIAHFKTKIAQTINEDANYLKSDLTLKGLAENIELHPNKLSWLLNTAYHQNFNDYINSFRINHFKKLVIDPKNSHITILGLAYDSGFNSKSVFNTYFKKVEGITPSQWVKNQSL